MSRRSIAGMKVNLRRCHTCPFNPDGVREIRTSVEQRCLTKASQLCHGTDNKTLCRGARDFQLMIFHRLGFLTEPTDKAWAARMVEVLLDKRERTC